MQANRRSRAREGVGDGRIDMALECVLCGAWPTSHATTHADDDGGSTITMNDTAGGERGNPAHSIRRTIL